MKKQKPGERDQIPSDTKSDIEQKVRRFLEARKSDIHHRYKSWEHCYRYFRRRESIRKAGVKGRDHAALHLGFFLASWGMYRGSSFLLKKDYKIHRDAVKVLLRSEYDSLLDIDFSSEGKTKDALRTIWKLVEALRDVYAKHAEESGVSDTLVTKIILATCGCTPAYDYYFVEGMRKNRLMGSRVKFSKISKDQFARVCKFYRDHVDEFKRVPRRSTKNGIRYPAMKLVDMYFWEVGRSLKPKRH